MKKKKIILARMILKNNNIVHIHSWYCFLWSLIISKQNIFGYYRVQTVFQFTVFKRFYN